MRERADMKKYFREQGDQYMVSGAALLWLTSKAINSSEAGAEGKARARRVVEEVIAAGRAARFEKAEILETMLVNGALASRLLPLGDDLIRRIGLDVFMDALMRAGFNAMDIGGQE